MACNSVNFDKSTEELSDELAESYGVNAEERHNVLREMRKMRLSQKVLLQKRRNKYSYKTKTEDEKRAFLRWLEDETQKANARCSDSDEQN